MNTFSASARVGADAELRTAGQSQVCSVRLAVSAGFGEKRSTLWLTSSIWGARGAALANRLTKGTQVAVTGELSVREYTGRDGAKAQSLEVAIDRLDFVGGEKPAAEPARAAGWHGPQPGEMSMADEIPF